MVQSAHRSGCDGGQRPSDFAMQPHRVARCDGQIGVGFFFSSRRRHTRLQGDWSSDVCSSDLDPLVPARLFAHRGLAAAMAVTALYSATFSSLPYFLTLYFQTVRGYSAFATGDRKSVV